MSTRTLDQLDAEVTALKAVVKDLPGYVDPVVVTPTPTPIPDPTPVPVPTPLPTPTPSDLYAIPAGAKTLPAGSRLAGLAPGNYALEGGDYANPGGKFNGVNLYAANPRAVTLKGDGKQLVITNGGLFGINGIGSGLATKLNDKAAVILGDKSRFIGGGWSNALGVAIAGDGSEIQVIGAWLFDNGSAGVGGKCDDALISLCWCKGNNVKVRDSDGAVLGKFTRSNRITIKGNRVESGPNAAIWGDISNGPGVIADNVIRDIGLLKSYKPWTGVGIKLEISLPGWVISGNDIAGTGSYCIDLNETYDVDVFGNKLEESPKSSDGGVLGIRNLARSDAPSSPANAWKLGNIRFHHNVLTKGFGTITGSNAGDKGMKLSKYGITVNDNAGEVRYQNVAP